MSSSLEYSKTVILEFHVSCRVCKHGKVSFQNLHDFWLVSTVSENLQRREQILWWEGRRCGHSNLPKPLTTYMDGFGKSSYKITKEIGACFACSPSKLKDLFCYSISTSVVEPIYKLHHKLSLCVPLHYLLSFLSKKTSMRCYVLPSLEILKMVPLNLYVSSLQTNGPYCFTEISCFWDASINFKKTHPGDPCPGSREKICRYPHSRSRKQISCFRETKATRTSMRSADDILPCSNYRGRNTYARMPQVRKEIDDGLLWRSLGYKYLPLSNGFPSHHFLCNLHYQKARSKTSCCCLVCSNNFSRFISTLKMYAHMSTPRLLKTRNGSIHGFPQCLLPNHQRPWELQPLCYLQRGSHPNLDKTGCHENMVGCLFTV